MDFDGQVVTIREKKRVRGRQTTRRVPLSPFLAGVLREWLAVHPGGNYLFCHSGEVERSKKRSRKTGYFNGVGRPTTDKGRLAALKDREQPGIRPVDRERGGGPLLPDAPGRGMVGGAGVARITT